MDKIKLPDVTLIATTSIEIPGTILAMQESMKKIDFGDVILLSHEKPENLPKEIRYIYYKKITNVMDFNYLMWEDLWKYFDTSHCLTVQHHAWVTNPELWNNDWLQYDWIGAPWEIREGSYIANTGERVRVGNGGFSLRSKKISRIPSELNLPLTQDRGYFNEDGNYTCYYRKQMLENGIKYAPIEVASKFSFETPLDENLYGYLPTFGFHRVIR